MAQPQTSNSSQTTTTSQTTTEQQTLAGFAPEVRLSARGEARVHNSLELIVGAEGSQTQGQLFGSPATIRFTPVSAAIAFGDGQRNSGSVVAGAASFVHSYGAAGAYRAEATVRFRVDYRLGQESWVVAAAWVEVATNPLLIEVLEPERRTLLIPIGIS